MFDWINAHAGQVKTAGDIASAGTVVGAVLGYLPAIAAFFTLVWTIMRIVDEWPAFKARVRSWFK